LAVRLRLFWPVTIAAAALVGLLAYGVASKGRDTTLDSAIAAGKHPVAPVRTLPRLQGGGSSSLAAYRGKVVVLNMWASWCLPCRQELPLLQKTQQQIAARGGVVLGIDTADESSDAIAFLAKHEATFPSLRDRDRGYSHDYGVVAYPETFVVDRGGRVVALHRGPVTSGWLQANVDPLLRAAA